MYQVTVLGDVAIDNFISISSEYAETACRISDEMEELIIPYGGKIPTKDVEIHCGGNAANIAIGLKRLNINILPIIPIGTDVYSNFVLSIFEKEGIELDPSLISKTNKCNISFLLRFQGERTIFSHHEQKNYLVPENISTEYYYYSSHSSDNNVLSTEILRLKQLNKSKLIFAPSNTQIHGNKEILEALVSNSYVLICNREEAFEILKNIDEEELNIKNMLYRLNHLGAQNVVITDGGNGVNFYNSENEESFHMDSKIDQEEIVDATGAGDAMCTGVIYGLINGKSLNDSVEIGIKNSVSVLKYVGAQTGLLKLHDLK